MVNLEGNRDRGSQSIKDEDGNLLGDVESIRDLGSRTPSHEEARPKDCWTLLAVVRQDAVLIPAHDTGVNRWHSLFG